MTVLGMIVVGVLILKVLLRLLLGAAGVVTLVTGRITSVGFAFGPVFIDGLVELSGDSVKPSVVIAVSAVITGTSVDNTMRVDTLLVDVCSFVNGGKDVEDLRTTGFFVVTGSSVSSSVPVVATSGTGSVVIGSVEAVVSTVVLVLPSVVISTGKNVIGGCSVDCCAGCSVDGFSCVTGSVVGTVTRSFVGGSVVCLVDGGMVVVAMVGGSVTISVITL